MGQLSGKNRVTKRLAAFRREMEKNGIDYYMITSSDCHGSEYVHEHFHTRAWLSGFTGSNGTLLVSGEDAFLWTDGRYYLQAEEELSGSGIGLMRQQEKGVPTIAKYLEEHLKAGQCLAFDGNCVSASRGEELESVCERKGAALKYETDLANSVWKDRPGLPKNPIWILEEEYAGKSCGEKLKEVRYVMERLGTGYLFLNSLDDIMWLFNLRGGDIAHNPVALSYAVVGKRECYLFLQKEEAGKEAEDYLSACGVELEEYTELRKWIERFDFSAGIFASRTSLSYGLKKILSGKGPLVLGDSPTELLKAMKNETESERLREAYIRDSAAVCRFIFRLKKQIKEGVKLTEISAAGELDSLRREIPDFLDLSFPTICGYRENGAIVHYEATGETNRELSAESMVLIDSGGQYKGGTTDVTRTIVLGEVSEEEKRLFSAVAAGMLRLADAVFPEGATGRNLDILARQELWKQGLDYRHGTGHGIGFVLNVHEGPQRIGWQYNKSVKEYALRPGMIVSDEPGVYLAGRFGVRIENILEVVKAQETEYGNFLKFDMLTWVPIDREALDIKYLSGEDVERIDRYHAQVYEKIAPYLAEEEKEWLRKATKPL